MRLCCVSSLEFCSLLFHACTYQIGPRMELEVVKVEEGLCDGRVLFHSLINRTAAATAAQQAEIDERQRLKAERRREQVCF